MLTDPQPGHGSQWLETHRLAPTFRPWVSMEGSGGEMIGIIGAGAMSRACRKSYNTPSSAQTEKGRR